MVCVKPPKTLNIRMEISIKIRIRTSKIIIPIIATKNNKEPTPAA
jgi:hypothetical protein